MAKLGIAAAQNNLADLYDTGRGTSQDYSSAFYWYEKAAQQGVAESQVSLGWYYMAGLDGIPIDYPKAVYWNEQGARRGHPEGFNNLGYLYEHGLGVAQDLNIAANLYQNAINKGIEIGVKKERIDEAKSRLANLTKLKAINRPSGNQVNITESNESFRVESQNGMKFEIKGNLPKIKKQMRESRLSPKYEYESASNNAVIKHECVIKPVMTKQDIENCKN